MGIRKKGDSIMDYDFVFLTEKETMWAEMLKDVLQDNSIPFVTKNKLGAAMALKVGPMMERVSFFVPNEHLEKATEIVATLFSENSEVSAYED